MTNPLLMSEDDEKLMLSNVMKCYDTRKYRISCSTEHYRYLVEQIVALRQVIKRAPESVASEPPCPA